ncbi:MAG: DNA polymerase III subunit gamma/tau [Clostridia bacterium]|nr:DNA polymerase III subunit gamma/tau [Clostridia bacterium]
MYQALYRKYRPRNFSEVVGQKNIVKTLKNQITDNHISHAYLFTGSRGTGKTSCAKIFAKAVNCLNSQAGDPCNECEICKGINDESIFDITEIDAASNNGVDNIRELRDNTAFSPATAKYRIYIIDEVHMLSGAAFNALLKTLEEPPAHVIFILATTEVHKLPATILSRCQRFDFSRIAVEEIAARLTEIAEKEGISLTPDAALIIAKLSDGAMRDALSLLDVCAATGNEVDEKAVLDAAGMSGREYIERLALSIVNRNSEQALETIAELYERSKDMTRLCCELIEYFRNIMMIKATKNPEKLVVCSSAEIEKLKKEGQNMPLDAIIHAIEVFEKAFSDMNRGANRRTIMETALIRLCDPSLDESMTAVLRRISALEAGAVLTASARVEKDDVATEKGADIAATQVIDLNEKTADITATQAVKIPNSAVDIAATQAVKLPENAADKSDIKVYQKKVTADDIKVPSMADDNSATVAFAPVSETKPQSSDQPYKNWNDILGTLGKTDPMMKAALEGSQAYIVNDCMLIDFKNESFRDMINTSPRHKSALKAAIVQVTGTNYKIGPYTKKKAAGSTPEPNADDEIDPLDDLVSRARQAGIDK